MVMVEFQVRLDATEEFSVRERHDFSWGKSGRNKS